MLETFLQVGTHGIALRVVDRDGQTGTDTTVIHVADTRAPAMTLSVSPATLRPADHRLVDVTVSLHTTDECGQGVTFALESVISNEPDDAPGGATATPWPTSEAPSSARRRTSLLRAERSSKGTGRRYTLTYVATDAAGRATRASAVVTVPRPR